MRNYVLLRGITAVIQHYDPDGQLAGTNLVDFIGSDDDDVEEQVRRLLAVDNSIPGNDYRWNNPEEIADVFVKISKRNLAQALRFVDWFFTDNVLTCWDAEMVGGAPNPWPKINWLVKKSPRKKEKRQFKLVPIGKRRHR